MVNFVPVSKGFSFKFSNKGLRFKLVEIGDDRSGANKATGLI